MSEYPRKRLNYKSGTVLLASLFAVEILAGCGTDINASEAKGESCRKATLDDWGFRWNSTVSTTPITSPEEFLSEASGYVEDLYRRAEAQNGSWDSPEYNNVEVITNKDQLKFALPDNENGDLGFGHPVTNSIIFKFEEGEPALNIASLTCQGEHGVYPTIFFDKLKQYDKDSESLG